MKSPEIVLVLILSATTLFAVSCSLVISTPLTISNIGFNGSLDVDPKLTLKGRFGRESLPIIPVLMAAVEGLADMAYLEPKRRIRGFHVANPPQYTDNDISIQPAPNQADFEVGFAVWGLYYVLYTMVMTKTYNDSDFLVLWNDVEVGRIIIQRRRIPSIPDTADFDSSVVPEIQNSSSFGKSAVLAPGGGTMGLDYFFDFMEDEKIAPQEVFLIVMAALKDISKQPDTDVVKPFRSKVPGIKAGIQFMELEKPRTEPPYLLYGNLIDTIRKIPSYSLDHKRFGGMTIIISFDNHIIGEAMMENDR